MSNLLPPDGLCHQQDALSKGAPPAYSPPGSGACSLCLGRPHRLPASPPQETPLVRSCFRKALLPVHPSPPATKPQNNHRNNHRCSQCDHLVRTFGLYLVHDAWMLVRSQDRVHTAGRWGQFRVLPQPRSKRQSPPHLLVVFKLLEQCISPAAFPGHVCCIILKGQPFQQNECSAV